MNQSFLKISEFIIGRKFFSDPTRSPRSRLEAELAKRPGALLSQHCDFSQWQNLNTGQSSCNWMNYFSHFMLFHAISCYFSCWLIPVGNKVFDFRLTRWLSACTGMTCCQWSRYSSLNVRRGWAGKDRKFGCEDFPGVVAGAVKRIKSATTRSASDRSWYSMKWKKTGLFTRRAFWKHFLWPGRREDETVRDGPSSACNMLWV